MLGRIGRFLGIGGFAVGVVGLALPATAAAAEMPNGVPQSTERATVTGYVDGDTFKISRNGKGEIVELRGVDAPEIGECYGQEAADRLAALLPKKTKVYLERAGDDRDDDDRLLRYVWVAPEEGRAFLLNTKLVREGIAAYDAETTGRKYVSNLKKAGDNAEREKPGFWAACGGNHAPLPRTPEELKAEYQPLVDVRELAIRPGGMLGQKIVFYGTIRTIQVAPPGRVALLGDTDPQPYGAFLQVEVAAPDGSSEWVVLGFSGDTTGMFEGTSVVVYGTVRDTYTGTNLLGGTITQPLVAAQFVEFA